MSCYLFNCLRKHTLELITFMEISQFQVAGLQNPNLETSLTGTSVEMELGPL